MENKLQTGQKVIMKSEGDCMIGYVMSYNPEHAIIRFDDHEHPTIFSKEELVHFELCKEEDHNEERKRDMETYSEMSFQLPFKSEGEQGYVIVNPEMSPAVQGLSPTGRYLVYCLHPKDGSCSFIIEQDENCEWFSECLPPFLNNDFICFITDVIESKNK